MNITLMDLFVVTLAWGILSYAWESGIGPVLRSGLRYRLFAVRDQVRSLMITHRDDREAPVLDELHASVNSAIRWLDHFNFPEYQHVKHLFETDPTLKARIEEREKLLQSSSITEVAQIREKTAKLIARSILINSAFYIVPFIYLVAPLIVYKTIREKLSTLMLMRVSEEHGGMNLCPA